MAKDIGGGASMITFVGEMHRTREGKAFSIDYAQVIPEAGAYDLVLFGLRRGGRDFSMGVAFPQESVNAWGAYESLVREGLAHLRAELDHGNEEDGSLIEVPSNVLGGWRPSYRFSARPRARHA